MDKDVLRFSYDITYTSSNGKRGVIGPLAPQEQSFVEWAIDSYLRNEYYGYTHHLTHEDDE